MNIFITFFKKLFSRIIDKTDTNSMQTTSNLVTSITDESTDVEYPSAKCVYDAIKVLEKRIDDIEYMLNHNPKR